MTDRGRSTRVVGAVLALVVLSACAGSDRPAAGGSDVAVPDIPPPVRAPDRGTVRVGLGRDPVSIDPRTVVDDEGEQIVRALFEGLVDIAPDGSIVPAGAVSWAVEDAGTVYTFQLREARFHDGRAVTADDHARALLGVFDPARPPFFRDDLLSDVLGASVADEVAPLMPGDVTAPVTEEKRRGLPTDVLAAGGIEIVAADVLVVRLAAPDERFLASLSDVALMPVPPRAVSDPERFAQEPVGNGPFRMAGPREPGGFIRLAAVTDHHRAPGVDGLLFQVYPADGERSQRWADLLAGRLQITAVPVDRRREAVLLFGRGADLSHGPGLLDHGTTSLYAYGFDVTAPPFDDVRVRQAIGAAIDREALARDVLAGSVDPASSLLPMSTGGMAGECGHCVFDPELARELLAAWLADAGESAALPPIVLTYPRGPGHVTVAERIASDLEETLGIDVRLRVRDLVDLNADVASGAAAVFRLGLRARTQGDGIASSILDPEFRPGDPDNRTGWLGADPDGMRRRLDELAATNDPDLARSIEAIVLEDAAVVPLFRTRHDLVVAPDVVGFRLDPSGRWWPELLRLR